MKFPNECCRCGLCCLSETCMIGMEHYNIKKYVLCPALEFNDKGISTCGLSYIVPIGDGCCIKARAVKSGIEFNIADLPKKTKFKIVEGIRKGITPLLSKAV